MSLTPYRTRIGSLDCIVIDGGTTPTTAAVICHGYGASNDDLAPLAGEWMRRLGDKADRYRFVFPNAPHSLAEQGLPEGRGWWPLNMMQMAMLVAESRFDELHDEQPPEIAAVRDRLCETIRAVQQGIRGDATPLVLGGFSQGAMIALECSLRGSIDPPKFLIQFSGTVVCRPHWIAALDRLKNAYVFQSHGTLDPILPFSSALLLNEILENGGIKHEFHRFDGGHAIDQAAIEKTADVMKLFP